MSSTTQVLMLFFGGLVVGLLTVFLLRNLIVIQRSLRRKIMLCLVLISLFGIVGVICAGGGYLWGYIGYALIGSSSNAMSSVQILELLRKGDTEQAIRCLEGSLDDLLGIQSEYMMYKRFLPDVCGEKEMVAMHMSEVVSYRKAHPYDGSVNKEVIKRVLDSY